MREDILFYIALSMANGLSCKHFRELIQYAGDARAVFDMDASQIISVIGNKPQNAIRSIVAKDMMDRAERELEFVSRNNIRALTMVDDDYPKRLNNPICNDTPGVIYYKGHADLNASKTIGIVGTRKATPYGLAETMRQTSQLKQYEGLVTISGLAYGIDTAAHKSSIENNIPTIGILGHGFKQLYPDQNRNLARTMVDGDGGLLTEYPSDTLMNKSLFPARNRIIAAMSDALIVVEAAEIGGALITAKIAATYKKDIFAIPGRNEDPYSKGCNNLLADGDAHILRSADDIGFWMGWKTRQSDLFSQVEVDEHLPQSQCDILQALRDEPGLTLDDLSSKLDISMPKLATSILHLELNGRIICLPGKKYKII